MATAAHTRKLYVRTDTTAPSGSDEIDGAVDFSWSSKTDILETTDFKDTTGTKTKIAGLKDGSGSIGGDWEQSDTIQGLLRTAHNNGTLVYVTDLKDGTNGYTYPCLVESLDEKGAVAGKNEVTFSLTQSGASIARP
jgi:hypothetical protein